MIYNDDLRNLIPLLNFLADTFGESFEFALHDLSRPGGTIIAIRNGHVTNRKEGDSLSNFTLRALKEQIKTDEEFNIFKEKVSFRKNIKSSDHIIRNQNNEIIGLICVNFCIDTFSEMKKIIDSFLTVPDTTKQSKRTNKAVVNNIMSIPQDISFKDIAISIIENTLSDCSVQPERMTAEEKMQVIAQLKDKGIFQLKGIVTNVAEKLYVSEATIYRYLNNL